MNINLSSVSLRPMVQVWVSIVWAQWGVKYGQVLEVNTGVRTVIKWDVLSNFLKINLVANPIRLSGYNQPQNNTTSKVLPAGSLTLRHA